MVNMALRLAESGWKTLSSGRNVFSCIAGFRAVPHRLFSCTPYFWSMSEVEQAELAAQARAKYGNHIPRDTVFSMILKKTMPATILWEDEKCVAFKDINPVAPVHFLVVPRLPVPRLKDAVDDDAILLGHLLLVAKKCAQQVGIAQDGYRVVINDGKNAGQSVQHLHVHVLGGRQLDWPPG